MFIGMVLSYRATRSTWRSRSAKASAIKSLAIDDTGRRSCAASRSSLSRVAASSLTVTLGAVDIVCSPLPPNAGIDGRYQQRTDDFAPGLPPESPVLSEENPN
jgi:hypothetical protein